MDPMQILSSEQISSDQALTSAEPLAYWARPVATREQQIKRFLKIMLPSIPVVAFSVDFLYTYITQASLDIATNRPIDGSRPFLGALLLALIVSLLCIFIYNGVLKILDETGRGA